MQPNYLSFVSQYQFLVLLRSIEFVLQLITQTSRSEMESLNSPIAPQ